MYIDSCWPFVHCVRNLFVVFTDQLENCCLIIPTLFLHFTHHISIREENQFLLVNRQKGSHAIKVVIDGKETLEGSANGKTFHS